MSSPTSLFLDHDDLARRLLALTDRTGYEILQKHGQRIFGGPPPGWTGPQPDKGTEVYCYKIPRDCFEDELVPVFSSVGKIYELRLMIEFSGTNRSYCYVRYTTQEEAREAIRKLNNYHVRPGFPLAVTKSVDNRKLSIKTVPTLGRETENMIVRELGTIVEGVEKVLFEACGWLEVEFSSHRLAALARRQLVPGNVLLFDKVTVKQVDWADPETQIAGRPEESMSRVISVRNIPFDTPEIVIANFFNRFSEGQVINVVKAESLVLITFMSQVGAVHAMERCRDIELGGERLKLSWWRHKVVDNGSYASIPRIQHLGRQYQGATLEQSYRDGDHYSAGDMMTWMARRNLMATQLVRQVTQPPPVYNLVDTFSGLSLTPPQYQATQYPPPPTSPYLVPPPLHMNIPGTSQYMPSTSTTFPLFPINTTRPVSPKPVLAVPPVYRGSGNTLD